MKYKIGCVGVGFVGEALITGFETVMGESVEIFEYDRYKNINSLNYVVDNCNMIFLCLPTPTDFESGGCDLTIVRDVCKEISEISQDKKTLIIKSTVPPKTTQTLQDEFPQHCFVFCPEFLREKTFIQDFIEQDRIILGYTKETKVPVKLYNLFLDFTKKQKKSASISITDSTTAELVKYTTNCFLATKVAFFNEIYEVCKLANVDYENLKDLVTLDDRITNYGTTVPGPDGQFGFSGKCFPKDLNALIYFAKSNGLDPFLLEAAWSKNLLIREKHDWLDIPGASTENLNFGK